jgi:anthraniloyl-CoA monooxygenase
MPDSVTSPSQTAPMFQPLTLRGVTLANRVVVSPMCMYSANDGTVGDFQLVHLGSRAQGGAGLVFTEMTDVSPEGRISPYCAGMYKPEHRDAWKRIVDFVHGNSDSKIGVQLAHAGRKGSTPAPWQRGEPLGDKGWPLVAPSAIPFDANSPVPKEMDRRDLDKVRDDFARAARWADEAGFDVIEFHMGHGYLLSSFLSPLSNKRSDDYGGSLENRLRFPLEVVKAVRGVWPATKPLFARISASDWEEGGNTIEDGVAIARALKAAGIDVVDASSGNVTSTKRPPTQEMFQVPLAERIRKDANVITMAVGNIRSVADVNGILSSGKADLCAIGRWHLFDPYFARHAARDLGSDGVRWPNQYQRAAEVVTPRS